MTPEEIGGFVYVVGWMYGDRSGFGMIRAFENEEQAKDLCRLLEENSGSRLFTVDAVQVMRSKEDNQ